MTGLSESTLEFVQHYTKVLLFNRFNIIGSRGRPPYDEQQNFMDEMVTRENGVTTISFRRPVVSPDNDDDFDLNQCRWVLWANGGPITAVSDTTGATFGGHSAKGVFSRQMCLCSKFYFFICLLNYECNEMNLFNLYAQHTELYSGTFCVFKMIMYFAISACCIMGHSSCAL